MSPARGAVFGSILLVGALLGGCATATPAGHNEAVASLNTAADELHFGDGAHGRIPPGPGASLADYIRFAEENHPGVAAAWQEWRAAVGGITPAGSLPDPKLTFEADITDTLMTLMPGVMFDFMTAGKRGAMAAEKTAAAEVARRAFVAQVLKTAADVKRAWIELAYTTDAERYHLGAIHALEQWHAFADADYATGAMMSSLGMQVDLQSMVAEHKAQHEALLDRRVAAHARFKFALGLQPSDPDPQWPAPSLEASPVPDEDELWARTLAANPELAQMRAMIDMAVAGVEVARKGGTPDFTLGLMSDLKASPLMFRPTASLSLPIWRNKIDETIRSAEARREGAGARLDAAKLEMAAQLAQMFYMVRESDRMLGYIGKTALPSLERESALAAAAYQSGAGPATKLADAALRVQLVQLQRAEILRSRENAVTDLLTMSADIAPASLAPITGTRDTNH